MKTVENTNFKTFVKIYDHCYIIYIGIYPSDYYKELPPPIDINEFEENPNNEDNIIRNNWKKLTGQLL